MKRSMALLLLCVSVSAVFAGCGGSDVTFARRGITGLAQGRYATRKMIDWTVFTALDKDIGAEYRDLANDKERLAYERSFIDNFKTAFRAQKGSLKAFYDWRFYGQRRPDVTIVAASIKEQDILFLVVIRRAYGTRKIIGIKALRVLDEDKLEEFRQEFLQ
ncbi:MAG: hypothetical protein WC732_05865 [Candidatus Omnitrophota bacterium]